MVFEYICNLRKDNDLRQWQLAQFLNISRTAYSRCEPGQQIILHDILVKPACFYNMSAGYPIEETDTKNAARKADTANKNGKQQKNSRPFGKKHQISEKSF